MQKLTDQFTAKMDELAKKEQRLHSELETLTADLKVEPVGTYYIYIVGFSYLRIKGRGFSKCFHVLMRRNNVV